MVRWSDYIISATHFICSFLRAKRFDIRGKINIFMVMAGDTMRCLHLKLDCLRFISPENILVALFFGLLSDYISIPVKLQISHTQIIFHPPFSTR